MNKIFLGFCLLVLVACSITQTPVPTGPALTLSAHTEGETVAVTISAANIAAMQGAQFNLRYNTLVLQYDHAAEGPLLKADGTQTMFMNSGAEDGVVKNVGVIRISQQDVAGNGELATIYFTKLSEDPVILSLEEVIVIDSKGNKIAVKTPILELG